MVKVQIPANTPLDDGKGGKKSTKKSKDEDDEDDDGVGIMSDIEESDVDDDIGDPDWEEVKTKEDEDDDFSFKPGKMPDLPVNGVTISISRPRRGKRGKSRKKGGSEDEEDEEGDSGDEFVSRKKKRRETDLNEVIRKSINRVKITEQLMKHKMSLLMYLARGLRLVKIINCSIITGLSMSIVDHRFNKFNAKNNTKEAAVVKRGGKKNKKQQEHQLEQTEREMLGQFMEQFNEVVDITSDDDKRAKHMQQPFMLNMLDCFKTLEATSLMELVVMFVACLKAFNPKLPVRIVNVLRPISLRANIIPKPSAADGKEVKPIEIVDLEKEEPEEIIEKLDFWLEVYLADEKKWCCVDLCNCKLDEPNVLTELSRPFNYLVSYDVDRHCVKPAEKNYCDNWYTPGFRKGRCEDKWWDSVMAALGPVKQAEKDKADEIKTEQILEKQDMPKSDNGFRNHPLYVLERHLLKFQGIYPPEVAPLGFFKEQPVYPRDCVHVCRSRETWLRQARTVKQGETAYKVVKARPKRDKYTGDLIRDLPLELFGEWQTEPYDPPQAENGKVPRNCYGNVDMYQECMLPKGCAWLKLTGLPRIANKLGIDCAAAVVGFDNHCGSYGAHPVMEGFVICEEFAETLTMAWEEEQANSKKREEEKRQKRVWDNWRRLLKATMIREKLRVKYKSS